MELNNHGANPLKTYQLHLIEPPKKIIDFSTNTNVCGKKILLRVNKLAKTYPDFEALDVRNLLKNKHQLRIGNFIVSNGINEIIYLLAVLFKDKNVAILKDDYSEYARAFMLYSNVAFYDKLGDINHADLVIFSNPNNPTGKLNNYDSEIMRLRKEALVVIDESYMEFIKDKQIVIDNNVIVLRSLTKIYHLSGLRIGYAVAKEELINTLKKHQPTWSVNSVALSAAKKYLNDRKFLERTRQFYKSETKYLKKTIEKLGYEINDSDANFFLIKTFADIALIEFLLRKGVVVRHTRNYANLKGKYIRVSVKKRRDNKILIKALKEFNNENISNSAC